MICSWPVGSLTRLRDRVHESIEMPRVHIETYGCAFNVADGESMAAILELEGYQIADRADAADAVVLNTCTVKNKTWNDFKKRLGELRSGANNGGPKIVLAGCIPRAHEHDPLIADLPAIGPDTIHRIGEVVGEALAGNAPKHVRWNKKERELETRALLPSRRRNPLVEILPISRGCLSACSFCQTRLARGKLKSFRRADLLERARRAIDDGVREIWLTSQDAGAWGQDSGDSLPDLLHQLCEIKGDFRIRLGMSSPNWIYEKLSDYLDALTHEKMFKFLHAPVQSGSDRVLAHMKREGTAAQFEEVACAFTARFPEGTFMTDLIVGYPTETDEDFEQTLQLIERCGIGMVNRSRYSRRPGTSAATLPSLPSDVVLDRSVRLEKLVRGIARVWHQKLVGKTERVLTAEQRGKTTLAHNEAYRPVFIEGILPLGAWFTVTHLSAADYHLKSRCQ